MQLFFVQDYKHKYRCFSSEPIHKIEVEFSRLKKIWKVAKEKLMLLPQRILAQEQAFERITKYDPSELQVFHSGRLDEKKNKSQIFLLPSKTKNQTYFSSHWGIHPPSYQRIGGLNTRTERFFWSPSIVNDHSLASLKRN